MQVQFPVKSVKSLRCILSQVQTTEETQQLRIPEPMADVGRIIGCWGQVLLRSKEWRDGYIAVSGGTMVWVMYVAEGEENGPQVAQAWLPFQMKWELPQLECDGQIRVLPYLDSVDARSSSARKIIVRTSVSVQAEAYLEDEGRQELSDYKVMCFGGEPKMIQLHRGRFGFHTKDFYDVTWNQENVLQGFASSGETIPC